MNRTKISQIVLLTGILLATAAVLLILIAQLVPLARQVIEVVSTTDQSSSVGMPPSVPTLSSGTIEKGGVLVSRALTSTVTVTATPTVGKLENLLQATVPASKRAGTALSTPTIVTERATADHGDSSAALQTANTTAGIMLPRGVVTGGVVNIRSGPGTQYDTIGQVTEATLLDLIGRTESSDWLQFCCPTSQHGDAHSAGWIRADFVDIGAASDLLLATLPVPPTPVPPTPLPVSQSANSQPQAGTGAGAGLPGPGGFSAPGSINPLTGLALPGGRNNQRPVVVCVNNDPAARPQWGLSQADLVYEYLMEGYGITRFSAIFYGDDVTQIGPVRSARLINYYMGALYDAGLVCSGASDQVRYSLKFEAPFPYMDIDLDDPSNSRYSVSIGTDYRTRLRTSTNGAHQWLADWGVERAPSLRSFTFGGLGSGGLPAGQIDIPYPRSTGSEVHYQYEPTTGRYLRWLGGSAHTDGNSGTQLAVDNVIVQYVAHEATTIVEDSLGSTSIRLNLFGGGPALLFRDGVAFVGRWRSESRGDLPHFYTEGGEEVALKTGRSWISVIPDTYTVSYQ